MRIGYSKGFGIVMIVLGGLQLVLHLLSASGNATVIRMIPGVICLVIGVLYVTQAYFTVTAREVIVPALIGPLKKTYPFEQLAELEIKGGALWVGAQKSGVRRWLADKGDWAKLEAHMGAAPHARPRPPHTLN